MTASSQHGHSIAVALRVASGPHAQAQATLGPGRTTVGRSTSNDVVLEDPMMAPLHFAVAHAPGRPRASLRLEALDGPLILDGRTLPPGSSIACGGGTVFHAGSTEFELSGSGAAAAVRRWPSRTALATGFGAGVVCAGIALVSVALHASLSRKAVVGPHPVAAISRPLHPAASVHAQDALQQRLDSAGLSGIALASLPNGAVEARGEIMQSQLAAWLDTQRWFDGQFGGKATLVDQVSATNTAPPLAIAAVWPGPNPYVIDGSGQKLFTGAPLRSGWTLERIEPDRVIIRRSGQTLAVRF